MLKEETKQQVTDDLGEEIEELGREEDGGRERQRRPKGPQDESREGEDELGRAGGESRRGEEVREGGDGCKDLKRSWGAAN